MARVENPIFPIGEIGESASVELELSDSDVCGKRKRGREIPEITKIDSGGCGGSAMEKPKKSREVLEFEDTYEVFDSFKKEMVFEREDFDPLRDYLNSDDDEVEEMKEAPFDREAVLKYIKQVRDSFAFDVDVRLPLWLEDLRYFIPLTLSGSGSYYFDRDIAHKTASFAIDEINADMNSKTYELVEVVRAVVTHPCYSLMFLTLTAKKVGEAEAEAAVLTIQAIVYYPFYCPWELHQWRVKPDSPAPAEKA